MNSLFSKRKIKIRLLVILNIIFLLLPTVYPSTALKIMKNTVSEANSNIEDDFTDTEFIKDVALELSSLIYKYPRGRDYGTAGELKAAEILERIWIENISNNVKLDEIDKKQPNDSIDFKINISDYKLTINQMEIPESECFPISALPLDYSEIDTNLRFLSVHPIPEWIYLITNLNDYSKMEKNYLIKNYVKRFFPFIKEKLISTNSGPALYYLESKKIMLYCTVPNATLSIDEEYTYTIIDVLVKYAKINPFLPIPSGFICDDLNDKTHFMTSSSRLKNNNFGKEVLIGYSIPGFMVSGDIGEFIQYSYNGEIYLTDVDFYIKSEPIFDVESYNVVGTIPGKNYGTDLDKTIVIGAHYDSWWGQCVIDNAIGIGSVWGLAKYYSDFYKDNPSALSDYTLKFVAFGGEEHGMRGSRYYVWKNIENGDEKLKFMINVDTICYSENLGHSYKNKTCLNIWQHPKNSNVISKLQDMVKESNYEQLSGGFCINVREYEIGVMMSDGASFKGHPEIAVISFDKGDKSKAWHFYHRTGYGYTLGDVWDLLDENDLLATSNVILSTINLAIDY
jgi:hypothetical protein